MKLLLYSNFFAPSVGGVETIVMSLARGLAELSEDKKDLARFDLTVVTGTPANGFDDRSLPFMVVRQPSFWSLRRLIAASDIVHIAGPALAPMFLAWAARKPYIVEHHGYQAICLNGILIQQPEKTICPGHFQAGNYGKCTRCEGSRMTGWRANLKLVRMFPRLWLAKTATRNIAVSEHVLRRIAWPRTQVILHGVEDAVSRTSERPPRAGKFRFAYVGRLVEEKGLLILLEAAKLLAREKFEFELLFIGDGPERATLESTIQRESLTEFVRITGFLGGPVFAEMMDTVDAVAMPSQWEETAGLAAMEQMIRGRLVIATKIGGLAETIGGAGLLCLPGSAQDLAQNMTLALQDSSLAARLGATARARAISQFSRTRMVQEHAAIYYEVVYLKR
jgi:glycogen synthase